MNAIQNFLQFFNSPLIGNPDTTYRKIPFDFFSAIGETENS